MASSSSSSSSSLPVTPATPHAASAFAPAPPRHGRLSAAELLAYQQSAHASATIAALAQRPVPPAARNQQQQRWLAQLQLQPQAEEQQQLLQAAEQRVLDRLAAQAIAKRSSAAAAAPSARKRRASPPPPPVRPILTPKELRAIHIVKRRAWRAAHPLPPPPPPRARYGPFDGCPPFVAAADLSPTPSPPPPHPIVDVPDSGSLSPPPAAIPPNTPSREPDLIAAKMAAVALSVLACGCKAAAIILFLVAQLARRGRSRTPRQLQSLFDFVCIKEKWRCLFVTEGGTVYGGLNRAKKLADRAQCDKFVAAHALVCASHWRARASFATLCRCALLSPSLLVARFLRCAVPSCCR